MAMVRVGLPLQQRSTASQTEPPPSSPSAPEAQSIATEASSGTTGASSSGTQSQSVVPTRRGPVSSEAAAVGGLPPPPSSIGKRYYALEARHGGPLVVAGARLAEQALGGSWVAKGRAPRGFSTLEEALEHLACALPKGKSAEFPVRFIA